MIVRVTGPDNFTLNLAEFQTIANLVPGTYIVTASSVASNGRIYNPPPASQDVVVTAGTTVRAGVSYVVGGPM